MRLPFLLPRDHPIVRREMAIWRKPVAWIWTTIMGLSLVFLGVALLYSLYLAGQSGLAYFLIYLFFPNVGSAYALYLFLFGLTGCLLASMVIAREHEARTWETLKLAHFLETDILEGKFQAVLRTLFWPWIATMIVLGWAVVVDFLANTGEIFIDRYPPVQKWAELTEWIFAIVYYVIYPLVGICTCITLGLLASTLATTRSRAIVVAMLLFGGMLVMGGLILSLFPSHAGRFSPQFIGGGALSILVQETVTESQHWEAVADNVKNLLQLVTFVFPQLIFTWTFYRVTVRRLEKGAKPLF